MKRPVLAVLHQEHASPGRVGLMLKSMGYGLDIRCPRLGHPLPETLDGHAGVVIFGGAMSANDPDDFVREEIDWISVPLRERAPYLGICLGAQMLAKQLGGTVAPHPEGRVEIGHYEIRPTAAGRALMTWPGRVYQWHREGFSVPSGATLLAEGDTFPNQAFTCGPCTFGLQFHPELTLAMMNRWTVRGSPRFQLPGAQNRAAHFEGRALHDWEVRAWLEGFLARWLAADQRKAVDLPAVTREQVPVAALQHAD